MTPIISNGEWEDMPKVIPEKYIGFVYEISCPSTGKYYIGKKLLVSPRRSKINKKNGKGKKTQIKIVESDWRTYWGSCNDLLADLKKMGEGKFRRRVLHLAESKFLLSYMELAEQLKRDVLFDPLSYNQIVNVRLRRAKP